MVTQEAKQQPLWEGRDHGGALRHGLLHNLPEHYLCPIQIVLLNLQQTLVTIQVCAGTYTDFSASLFFLRNLFKHIHIKKKKKTVVEPVNSRSRASYKAGTESRLVLQDSAWQVRVVPLLSTVFYSCFCKLNDRWRSVHEERGNSALG